MSEVLPDTHSPDTDLVFSFGHGHHVVSLDRLTVAIDGIVVILQAGHLAQLRDVRRVADKCLTSKGGEIFVNIFMDSF